MLPIIVTIPHASTAIPEELRENVRLSERDLLAHTDLATDRIYALPDVSVVQCPMPRVLLDVNRAPDDISKEYEMGRDGVVLHCTWDGHPIYRREPTEEEVRHLIHTYHDAFHNEIDSYIPTAHFLIDGHSYAPVGPPTKPDAGKERPEVCLGNMNYSTCTREHTMFFRDFFERHGYSVAINFPYQGRYTLGRHCHRRRIPHFLVPGIQVELNQRLYVDASTLTPKDEAVEHLHQLFGKLVTDLCQHFGWSAQPPQARGSGGA